MWEIQSFGCRCRFPSFVAASPAWRRCTRHLVLFIVAAQTCLSLLSTGCAIFGARHIQELYVGELSEDVHVSLAEDACANAALPGPEYNSSTLTLNLSRAGEVVLSRRCGFRGYSGLPDSRDPLRGFGLGELEGWSDDSKQRVWIIDKSADRVVASLDLDRQSSTGIDDHPPEWANKDEGLRLKRLSP